MSALVEVRGVVKSFGRKQVYENVDLEVHRGETFTILGPSGTGKSVLLKLLIGLIKPDSGAIFVDGVDIVPLDERELRQVRRKVGMLFQGAALFDSMSVGENVAYGLREHFEWPPERVRERVAECLAAVGLEGIEAMAPSALSGGMQKRVGLARALAPGPELILYDEPTTGLDPANTRRIQELIVSLKQRLGVTSIIITHDVASALAVSDRLGLVGSRRIPLIIEVESARRAPPPELESFMQGQEVES